MQCRIIKLDIQIFHDELWKPIYFGDKGSKVKVTTSVGLQRELNNASEYISHAGFFPVWVFALL